MDRSERASLSGLPPEIREYIYEYVLIRKDPIHFRLDRGPVLEPGLLAVNHLIRHETLPIFYGKNTFYASTHSVIEATLWSISSDKLPLFNAIQAFSTYKIDEISTDWWLSFVQHQGPILFAKNARRLIKRSALLIPLQGKDNIIWTTIDSLEDYAIERPEDRRPYFNLRASDC